MAIKVVEFYHLVGLQEKITLMKNERMEIGRLEEEREQRKKMGKHSTPIAAPRNHAQNSSHHRFEDFAPASVVIRKSLAAATPVINNARTGRDDLSCSAGWGPKHIAASVAAMRAEGTDPSPWDKSFEGETSPSSIADGKRKRDALDTPEHDIATEVAVSKKRALPPLGTPEAITAKSSKSRTSHSYVMSQAVLIHR